MKRYFYSLFILLSTSLFLIISGCKKDETPTAPQNHLPKIESLTANPTAVFISTETILTCIATDEDGDNLTISWSSKRGIFANGVVGVSVRWVAPSTAGTDTINVTVNDSKQTIQGKLEIIVGTISASPTLLTPSNNATEVALSPTLIWNAVSNAVSYTLQASASSSFTSFVYNQSGLTNTSQLISGLNHTSTYYWRVNSTNAYGTSGWSTSFTFKTGSPPQAPTLSHPNDGDYNQLTSPTLSWNASSGATNYTLQVSTSSLFAGYVFNLSGLTNTSQLITGLSNNTTFFWRVNATNSYGTSPYLVVYSFTTISRSSSCAGVPTVTYAGKTYNTIQIGNQCWLKENLDVGTMIQGNQSQSNNGTIEKYCYNNDPIKCATYGGLYQWNEVMAYSTTPGTKGICTDGWHIPTKAEFEILQATVGGNTNGNALKAIGQGTESGVGTNTSGFSALLAGYSYNGNITKLGIGAFFWSSTETNTTSALSLYLYYNDSNVYFSIDTKEGGYSVRCLKD